MNDIYILGVGHNTIVYIDLAESCGYRVKGLYHYSNDRIGENDHGYPILDSNSSLFKKDSLSGMNFAVSVGDNCIRCDLAKTIRKKGGCVVSLIHPAAIVSKFARIQDGVVINAGSVVQADACIETDCVLGFNVSVAHATTVRSGSFIATGSVVGAYITIMERVLIGQNSVIVSGKVDCIGRNSIIGAGSVVISNVIENCVVAGNPAKAIHK